MHYVRSRCCLLVCFCDWSESSSHELGESSDKYIHIYVYMFIHVHVYMHISMYVCVHACVHYVVSISFFLDQCVAVFWVCCSVLQCLAICCNLLQCVKCGAVCLILHSSTRARRD